MKTFGVMAALLLALAPSAHAGWAPITEREAQQAFRGFEERWVRAKVVHGPPRCILLSRHGAACRGYIRIIGGGLIDQDGKVVPLPPCLNRVRMRLDRHPRHAGEHRVGRIVVRSTICNF